MDGFMAYKYYMAIKLHFTNPKFDVFVNRGRIRITRERFEARNDHYLFEKLARQYPQDKDYIRFCASNFMYGNPELVYKANEAAANFKEYTRRKQSMTKVFTDDLATIVNSGARHNFSGNQIPDVLQLYLAKRITLETMVILNDLEAFVERVRENPQAVLIADDLLLIEKSKRFVTYDTNRILIPYQDFLEDIAANG